VAPLALVALGCVGSPDADAATESVGASSEAFSGYWGYSYGTTGNAVIDIGSSTDRTCFLTGVTARPSTNAEVSILPDGSQDWVLTVDPNYQGMGGAFASCVGSAAGRTPVVYWAGGPAKNLGAVTASRRCFLTAVRMELGFNQDGDYVRIFTGLDANGVNSWWLGGVQSSQDSYVSAGAVCIDVSGDDGSWVYQAGDIGTTTIPLAYNPGGVDCFLTGIGGRFVTGNWNDGVFITNQVGINQFTLTTVNGKTGWANCVN
jgi:hypothetical protein